jgi:hypothetical protein
LNNYAPSTGAVYGRCGSVLANPLRGYYDKIIAYGASHLQSPDIDTGSIGVYKPGSSSSLLPSYLYLHDGLSRTYQNDGISPIVSAQFSGVTLWQRAEAFDCDHRYMKDGYPEFVRSATATYTDLAFCASSGSDVTPSGTSGGIATSGTILGVPGGIMETIKSVSEIERVFNWAEQAYGIYLQPAGATTDIWTRYYFRYYPSTNFYVGVKDGNVYYQGPTDSQPVPIATLANFLAQAQAAGF